MLNGEQLRTTFGRCQGAFELQYPINENCRKVAQQSEAGDCNDFDSCRCDERDMRVRSWHPYVNWCVIARRDNDDIIDSGGASPQRKPSVAT
jgi:hypothetical protein